METVFRYLCLFQSTLPVGGATSVPTLSDGWIRISIHAPRGGSDERRKKKVTRPHISIHAPRGGSDLGTKGMSVEDCEFQSTLPVGGATGRSVLV